MPRINFGRGNVWRGKRSAKPTDAELGRGEGAGGRSGLGGGTQDQKMSKGHRLSVIYHQVYNVYSDHRLEGVCLLRAERRVVGQVDHHLSNSACFRTCSV